MFCHKAHSNHVYQERNTSVYYYFFVLIFTLQGGMQSIKKYKQVAHNVSNNNFCDFLRKKNYIKFRMARDPVLNFWPANQLLDVVELYSWNTVKIISVHKKFGKKY